MLKFSIVVPIYNVEQYLVECIESIIYQTYENIEIILVDDGSTDKCSIICDEYEKKDSRIKVIHKKNGGLVDARKAGTEIATGDFICPVDGDDYIAADYIEKFAEVLNLKHADILCYGYNNLYEDKIVKKALPYHYGFYSREKIEEEIFPILIQSDKAKYFAPNLWGKAFQRDLYTSIQLSINSKIKIGEDGACTVPCIYFANSISILENCSYFYRQNSFSMTKEKKAYDWEGPRIRAESISTLIDIEQFDFQEQMYRMIVHSLFNVVVSQFNKNEPYCFIKKDILIHLQDPIYKKAIQKAKFSDLKGRIALYIMRYKWIGIIWIWNRIKNR